MVEASSQPSGFTPITPNPYIVGNPVRNPAMFFGREAEFELVRKRFSQSDIGLLLVFCGERRSGKTSILFQILDGRLGPGYVPVLIDMQSMAIESEVAFLIRISEEIRRQLDGDAGEVAAPDFGAGGKPSAVFHAFIERVLAKHPGRKLLLMFDEYELLESKIDSKVITEDIVNVLSSLMESHPVFILLTGSHELEKRKREYWRTFLPKSDFRTISYLQPEDSYRLITRPVAGRVRYEDGIVDSIHRLTSGQPFYTQAICQRLVDYLNDHEDNVVTADVLDQVTRDIVENPLPQMIFMWDGFEEDEKLALSLLGEALNDGSSFATVEDLSAAVARSKYPVRTPAGRLATALEQLFKAEFLLKNRAGRPGYAFRMDLWRLWIKRMHSVWQVMRQIRAGVTSDRRDHRRRLLLGSTAVAAMVIAGLWWAFRPDHDRRPAGAPSVEFSLLTIIGKPDMAAIYIDDEPAGQGMVSKQVTADRNHEIRIAAPGHADSVVVAETIQVAALTRTIALRPLTGGLRVESDPPGAQVSIDGVVLGTTPVEVDGLAVPALHTISLTHRARGTMSDQLHVEADRLTTKRYVMPRLTGEVSVSTTPSMAVLEMDGVAVGKTPVTLKAIEAGKHTFRLRLDGYVSKDTTLEVGPGLHQWHQSLSSVPPGTLVVMGDVPARIFIDGKLVAANVLNSGRRSYPAGAYAIRAELVDGSQLVETVEVNPGEVITFDYSQRRVVSRIAEDGGQ